MLYLFSLIIALMAEAPKHTTSFLPFRYQVFLWMLHSGNYFFPLLLRKGNWNFWQYNCVRNIIQIFHMVGTNPLCLREPVLLQVCTGCKLGVGSVTSRALALQPSWRGCFLVFLTLSLQLVYSWKNIPSFMTLLNMNLFFKICFLSPAHTRRHELKIWACICVFWYYPLVFG